MPSYIRCKSFLVDNAGVVVSLTFGPPPPELARELERVRARAQALADVVNSINVLPEDFPKSDLQAITAQLAELPEGTGQGCLRALDYADTRLSEIRSQHISPDPTAAPPAGESPPPLARDEGVDRELGGLIADVATARRVAYRLAAAEPEERAPEPSVSRQSLPGLEQAEAKGKRAAAELAGARASFDAGAPSPSEPAQEFRRNLVDAQVVVGLSRVELAQRKIIPDWLRRFGGWISDTPARLDEAARVLESGTDIVRTFHGGWRKFRSNLTDAVYKTLDELAPELKRLAERERGRRNAAKSAEPFSIIKTREKILAGERIPEEWAPSADMLDFSREQLRDLAPLSKLTSLRRLDLSYTQVADLTALQGLTGLQSLELSRTQVADLTPLRGLTQLERLDLDDTPVSDLAPLRNMTKLRRLSIGRTRVTDTSVLAHLKRLEIDGP